MSPTDRTPFSFKHLKLARLSFENDEESEALFYENELTDTDSIITDDDDVDDDSYEEDEEYEEYNDDDDDEEFSFNPCEECTRSTPTGRFTTLDYTLKLRNLRKRLFVANVRRRLFSIDQEDEEIEG